MKINKKFNYIHTPIEELANIFINDSHVHIAEGKEPDSNDIMEVSLFTMRMAISLGIQLPKTNSKENLPYSDDHDNLLYIAPICQFLLGRKIRFLRGWKSFDSCVKGFNAIGLMAEHGLRELKSIRAENIERQRDIKRDFLHSRKSYNKKTGVFVKTFSEDEINTFSNEKLDRLDAYYVAIWKAFAKKPIVCSTSSNMGISLHQVLRYMQNTKLLFHNKEYTMLNHDEGWLIIWCPDEKADFMNSEKSETLRSIADEDPPLTVLHTYINRKQRDPGALKDALQDGGYFFPTNPQSKDEVQNLLSSSIDDLSKQLGMDYEQLIKNEKVLQTLKSLNCDVVDDKIIVWRGVEGGLYGLAVAYFLLLEEMLICDKCQALSTWNQASIGAALAAAVIGDMILRSSEILSDHIKEEFAKYFPNIKRYIDEKKIGRDMQTRIHGVFDIANLQSLAQLLGVTVERHLSGRGTAFVGLGSSSYANGNRCYEILLDSINNNGPFKGKKTFHPATHTINPVAQALIYGEDFYRVVRSDKFNTLTEDQQVLFIAKHAVKPEPAGAASLAGYLLGRLDRGSLSVVEIVYALKLLGFTKSLFLDFSGYRSKEKESAVRFIQEAYEEGKYMEQFAKCLLLLLDWDIDRIEGMAKTERVLSFKKYLENPLDDIELELLDPLVNIYITGDNTKQPNEEFIIHLLENIKKNNINIDNILKNSSALFKDY